MQHRQEKTSIRTSLALVMFTSISIAVSAVSDLWLGWEYCNLIMIAFAVVCLAKLACLVRGRAESEDQRSPASLGFKVLTVAVIALGLIGFFCVGWKTVTNMGQIGSGAIFEQRVVYRLFNKGTVADVSRAEFTLAGLLSTIWKHCAVICISLVLAMQAIYGRLPFRLSHSNAIK